MNKFSNTEAELKKRFAYKKACISRSRNADHHRIRNKYTLALNNFLMFSAYTVEWLEIEN